MKFRMILFLLTFIATMQVGLAFRTERVIRTVDAFEPVTIIKQEPETKAKAETRIEAPIELVDFESDYMIRQPKETVITEPLQVTKATEEVEVEPKTLGEYRITAYCACEKCCGAWALNRPNGIVYGAAGVELKAGISCASPLPFGTTIEIEGLGEYIVQDRIAQWVVDKYGENLIDIYFSNHNEAAAFGLKYAEVYKVVD